MPAIPLFLAFASAYFLSALIRAITATLAPTLVQEFTLSASDLGLLSGGYFFGFSMTQLPLGAWLVRFGPKRVLLAFLMVAVAGCLYFAAADSFWTLCAARVACGVGLSACLMAPLTAYRRWYRPDNQQRASSWMLMTGSLGFVASTLPVQWLMPALGWRGIFGVLAALLLLAIAAVAWVVPRWSAPVASAAPDEAPGEREGAYAGAGIHLERIGTGSAVRRVFLRFFDDPIAARSLAGPLWS